MLSVVANRERPVRAKLGCGSLLALLNPVSLVKNEETFRGLRSYVELMELHS